MTRNWNKGEIFFRKGTRAKSDLTFPSHPLLSFISALLIRFYLKRAFNICESFLSAIESSIQIFNKNFLSSQCIITLMVNGLYLKSTLRN